MTENTQGHPAYTKSHKRLTYKPVIQEPLKGAYPLWELFRRTPLTLKELLKGTRLRISLKEPLRQTPLKRKPQTRN